MNRAHVLILLALLFIAFIPRLWIALNIQRLPQADSFYYNTLAMNIVKDEGYTISGHPTAFFPPGYPLFLAFVYKLFGSSLQNALIAQAVISSLSCVLISLLARSLFGFRTGIISGLLSAFYPPFLRIVMYLRSENLYILFLLGMLLLWHRTRKTGKPVLYLSSGILIGCLTMIRGTGVFLLLALLLFLIVDIVNRKIQVLALFSLLFGFILIISPWIIRNYVVFNRLIPIASEGGITLYASYWPPVRDGMRMWGYLPQKEDSMINKAKIHFSESELNTYLTNYTVQNVLSAPLYALKLIPDKFISLYFYYEIQKDRNGLEKSHRIIDWEGFLIFPFSLIGMLVSFKYWRNSETLYAVIISVLLATIIFYGLDRFRLIADPALIILAVFGSFSLYDLLSKNKNTIGIRRASNLWK